MTGLFRVNLQLGEVSTVPASVAGAVILYADSTSHRLYVRNSAGAYLLGTMENPMTSAGDIIIGGAAGVPTRMSLGSANQVLTVDSTGTGLSYINSSDLPAVSSLSSDVSGLSSRVGALETSVSTLSGTVTSLGTRVGTLETSVSTLQSDVGTLQTTVAGKQDVLTAGTAITISSNTISADTATTQSLGISRPDGVTLTISQGVLSAVNTGTMNNPMTTQGDLIMGGLDGAAGRLGIGTSGQVLTVNQAGTLLEYQSLPIATAQSAGMVQPDGTTITISNGVISSSPGFSNPMTTQGDLISGGVSGAAQRLPLGTANYVLGVNSAGTDLQYSDGSSIPAVAQNTTDIEALQYQVNVPSDLYLTSTETSTGSGVYTLSLTEPTSSSPTTLTATVSDTEAKLYEFDYTFPAAGTIYKDNQYSIALPLSDLTTTESYVLRYVLKHVDANSTATNIVNFTANAIEPTSTTYTVQEDLPDILASDLGHAAGDKLILEVYGTINSGTADCNLVVEDTSLLATLHRQIPTTDISATHVLTTIGGSTITQQAFNESVANPMTTAGDIVVGGATGVPSRLGLGIAGQVLTVNSAATGLAYQDLPVATTQAAGIVQPDGVTITISDGRISASGTAGTTTFRYWD